MTGLKRSTGSNKGYIRPEIVPCDHSDEISDEAFTKLRNAVADINDPNHKRVIVISIDLIELL